MTTPETTFDPRYSGQNATATPWSEARDRFAAAELYWFTTVRADGRPHTVPLLGVWLDDAFHMCTGAGEQKARNLEGNPHCSIVTGVNTDREGTDVVVEGQPQRVTDRPTLQRLADAWEAKNGAAWHFDVNDEGFTSGGHDALVYRIAPVTAYAFAKGDLPGQTRYAF